MGKWLDLRTGGVDVIWLMSCQVCLDQRCGVIGHDSFYTQFTIGAKDTGTAALTYNVCFTSEAKKQIDTNTVHKHRNADTKIIPHVYRSKEILDDKHIQHSQTRTHTYLCMLSKADTWFTNCCIQFQSLIYMWNNRDGLWLWHALLNLQETKLSLSEDLWVPGFHLSQFLPTHIQTHTCWHTHARAQSLGEVWQWLSSVIGSELQLQRKPWSCRKPVSAWHLLLSFSSAGQPKVKHLG